MSITVTSGLVIGTVVGVSATILVVKVIDRIWEKKNNLVAKVDEVIKATVEEKADETANRATV